MPEPQGLVKNNDWAPGVIIFNKALGQVASHAGVFRGARISSLPTNACSTEDNIPFPLLHSRGKWPINGF